MSHGPHADASDPFQKRAAVAIAIYTVILAVANMLTNQARTEAILSSNRAADQWAFYQAKGTKQNLVKLEKSILSRSANGGLAAGEISKLDADITRYDVEKEKIRSDSEVLAAAERENEHKEHYYEYGATIVELAIILATMALLLSSKRTLYLSGGVAAISVALLIYSRTAMPHEPVAHSVERAATE